MATDPTRAGKLLARYSSGLLSAPEVAYALLVDLVSDDDFDPDLSSSVAALPDEIGRELRKRLQEIQSAGFRWKPFLLGPGGSVSSSEADDSMRLRRLCALLEIA
jgi:hypothetical protein